MISSKNIFKKNKVFPDLLDPDEIFADSIGEFGRSLSHEEKLELPVGRLNIALFLILIAAGMAYLSFRAGLLGVYLGENFLKKSLENRFLVRPVFPPRGVIFDRFGIPMASSAPSYGLFFERNKFLEKGGDLRIFLERLGALLGVSQTYFFDLGFPGDYDPLRLPQRSVVAENIGLDTLVSFAAELSDVPGVSVFESYGRVYRDAPAYSHLLGFVGEVSQDELARRPELRAGEIVGKSGLEIFYDKELSGEGGKKIIEVDSKGNETRFRFTEEPVAGHDMRLTIDAEFEQFVYKTIENFTGGKKGASAVVVDPQNGQVLALVSFPGFDSNSFSSLLSQKDFNAILKNPLTPLFNRAISGEFPSGSVIKPLISAAALEEGIIGTEKLIYDPGYIEIPNPYKTGEVSRFVDWRPNPQPRWIDFYDAIAQSANIYFYTIGGGFKDQKGLGVERIKKYALAFGLGSRLGIDFPGEKPGFIPDPESKKISEPQNPVWRVGDTYNISIGQGGVKVTPLQMAVLTASIANGGKLWRPYILDATLNAKGVSVQRQEPQLIRENMVSNNNIKEVVKGMRKTVTSGTARLLSGLPVETAAKTGTAEAGSGLPHAWVTAFAPLENPKIAIAVMVEHAGEGSTVAVPIMNEILKWYFVSRLKN